MGTGATAGADQYNGMVDCFKKIIKNEGYRHLMLMDAIAGNP